MAIAQGQRVLARAGIPDGRCRRWIASGACAHAGIRGMCAMLLPTAAFIGVPPVERSGEQPASGEAGAGGRGRWPGVGSAGWGPRLDAAIGPGGRCHSRQSWAGGEMVAGPIAARTIAVHARGIGRPGMVCDRRSSSAPPSRPRETRCARPHPLLLAFSTGLCFGQPRGTGRPLAVGDESDGCGSPESTRYADQPCALEGTKSTGLGVTADGEFREELLRETHRDGLFQADPIPDEQAHKERPSR